MNNLIQSLHHRFFKGEFLGNVLLLVSGTAFSQAILFLASPFITRLYKPDDFGAWSLIKSLCLIFSVVASWRYELSIVLPKQDKEAANLFFGSTLIATIMSFGLLLIVSFFGIQVVQLLSAEEILPWLWVLPLTLFLTGIYQSSNYWSTRKKNFRLLAIAGISQSIVMVSVQLALPFIKGTTASGLITGAVLGQVVATGILVLTIWIKDGLFLRESLSAKSIKRGIYHYRNFPLYVTPYSFISNFQQQIVLLLLGKFASTSVVGLYALASSIVRLPISLIGTSLNQVFFPKVVQQLESGELSGFVIKIMTLLVVLTTPLFTFFIYNAEQLFTIIFGNNWTEISTYAVWLSVAAFMMLYTSWLDRVYDVLNKQYLTLLMEIIYDIISISCFSIVLIWLQNPKLAVCIFSLVTTAYNFIWLIITFKIAKFPLLGIWKITRVFIISSAIISTLHLLAKQIISSYEVILSDLFCIVLYYICYGFLYVRNKREENIE